MGKVHGLDHLDTYSNVLMVLSIPLQLQGNNEAAEEMGKRTAARTKE